MGLLANIRGAISHQHGSDGQPLAQAFRSEAVIDRQIDELVGIIKGVMADGNVDQSEATFLLAWMDANRSARDQWPAKVIYPRLVAALSDGRLDIDEESEIMNLLLATVGGNTSIQEGMASDSTRLPLTDPLPALTFDGRVFCFTGKFASGTRSWCEQQVVGRGASIGGIAKKLHFLVIGEIGSRDWVHSTHGRKIEKAIELNELGAQIAIVSERYWHEALIGGESDVRRS